MTTTTARDEARVGPTLFGLMLALLVGLLATSIVATALPQMVADLDGTQVTYTWAVTGTLLAITVSTPIWGKLSDLVGRKGLIQSALLVFAIGAAVVGFAPDEAWLIVGRVLQGAGGGGLMALVQIVMADIISPRERGKYMGLFGAVMTVGTAGGPLIGGVVADLVGWRWNFLGSVPLALLAMLLLHFTLRLPVHRRRARLDVWGALTVTGAVTVLLVWVTLVGDQLAWASPISWGMIAAVVILTALAVVIERRVAEPIIPPALFRNRTFVLTVVASLAVGIAVYGTGVFVSQYLQLARGASPTQAGLLGLPQLIAVVIASTVVGAMISRTGQWKVWMLVGAASLTTGLGGLATVTSTTVVLVLWVWLALVGLGVGMVMQNLVLVAENAADIEHMGVTSAGVAFFRTLGGTIGVTVLGSVMATRSAARFDGERAALERAGTDLRGVDIATLPVPSMFAGPVRAALETSYAGAAADVFLATAPLALLGLVAIAFLPNMSLNTRTRTQRIAEREAGTAVDIGGGDGTPLDEQRP